MSKRFGAAAIMFVLIVVVVSDATAAVGERAMALLMVRRKEGCD